MKKKILAVGITVLLTASLLAGCNKGGIESQSDPKLIDLNPKGSEVAEETWATGSDHVYSAESEKGGNVITFAFLQDEEAKDQIASSILYFENLNERNIEYRMKKKGATMLFRYMHDPSCAWPDTPMRRQNNLKAPISAF